MILNRTSVESLPNETLYQVLDFLELKDARQTFNNLNKRFDGLLDTHHSLKSVSITTKDLKTCLDKIRTGEYSPLGSDKYTHPKNISISLAEMHLDDNLRQLNELQSLVMQLPNTQQDKSDKTITLKIPAFPNAINSQFRKKIQKISQVIQQQGFDFKCEVVLSRIDLKSNTDVNNLMGLLNITDPFVQFKLDSKSEIEIDDTNQQDPIIANNVQNLLNYISDNGIKNIVFRTTNQERINLLLDSKVQSFRLQQPVSNNDSLLIITKQLHSSLKQRIPNIKLRLC